MTNPSPAATETVALNVRIPKALDQWLRDTADERMVGVSFLVIKAIQLLQEQIAAPPGVNPPMQFGGGGVGGAMSSGGFGGNASTKDSGIR